jgi:hypothetical protein
MKTTGREHVGISDLRCRGAWAEDRIILESGAWILGHKITIYRGKVESSVC